MLVEVSRRKKIPFENLILASGYDKFFDLQFNAATYVPRFRDVCFNQLQFQDDILINMLLNLNHLNPSNKLLGRRIITELLKEMTREELLMDIDAEVLQKYE